VREVKLYSVFTLLRGGSIGTRLYTAFAATAGLTIAAGLVANLSFIQVEGSLTAMTNRGVRALEASGALEAGALRLNAIAPELRSTTNPAARAGATARIDVEFEAVRSALDTLEAIGNIPAKASPARPICSPSTPRSKRPVPARPGGASRSSLPRSSRSPTRRRAPPRKSPSRSRRCRMSPAPP
jgi:hypothetical protein